MQVKELLIVKILKIETIIIVSKTVFKIELFQGSKFSFRQTCPAGQVLPKTHSSLQKINLPCFSGVKMKKT